MARILLSFRRADSIEIVARIFDCLIARYGRNVFRDLDVVPPGLDFRAHVKEVVRNSDFMLAIVGPRWEGLRSDGSRALDNANAPIRIELETAEEYGLQVIPVLVNGARMPTLECLPASIRNFAFRNAAELTSGPEFGRHMERLIRTLDMYSEIRASESSTRVRSMEHSSREDGFGQASC